MSTEDLFSNANTTQDTKPVVFENEDANAPVIDPNHDWLSEYVGEGKKFRDAADLAKGKAHSDVFIARLQKEMDGLRQELNTRLKLEEFMDRMNSQNTQGASGQATQTAATGANDGTANNSALSPDDIEKVVEQKLQAKEAELRVQQNLEVTKAKLQEAFGANYVAELESRVNSLGLSKDLVNQLAKSEPKALFAMLGLAGQQRQQDLLPTSPRSSVNTAGMGAVGTAEKTYRDYEKIRKQNPGLYWSTQVQSEMHRQAMKLGERFYS